MPNTDVPQEAKPVPSICLAAEVTSGWNLGGLHCQNHGLVTGSCAQLRSSGWYKQPATTKLSTKNKQTLPVMQGIRICSPLWSPILCEVNKSQKKLEQLGQRRFSRVFLCICCGLPWIFRVQNYTWSYALYLIPTQLNAQISTKRIENSISRLENKGTASKHEEVRSSA